MLYDNGLGITQYEQFSLSSFHVCLYKACVKHLAKPEYQLCLCHQNNGFKDYFLGF